MRTIPFIAVIISVMLTGCADTDGQNAQDIPSPSSPENVDSPAEDTMIHKPENCDCTQSGLSKDTADDDGDGIPNCCDTNADAAECTIHTDCLPGNICRNNQCVQMQCQDTNDCPSGTSCQNNQCTSASPCLSDQGCLRASVCINGQCEDIKCSKNSDCGPKSICRSGACLAVECTKMADCGPSQICSGYTCQDLECKKDSECAYYQTCSGYVCTARSCASPRECRGNAICQDGLCVPVECNRDSDCPGEEICSDGQCIEMESMETEGSYGDGINCPLGWVTASASEVKNKCIFSGVSGAAPSADKYYCIEGRIQGRYCHASAEEISDSVINIQPGQRCTAAQANPAANTLRVHVIDVGQGDAIWIQTPSGNNVLIDGGDGGMMGKTSAGPIVTDYLEFHGFPPGSTFDAVFLSHPHSDHFGGLPNIFTSYNLKNYIDPMALNTSSNVPESYKTWIKKVQSKVSKSNIYMPAQSKFKPGALMPKAFFGADVDASYITSRTAIRNNANETTIIFKVTYAGVSFLFTGDAEKEQEAEAIASRVPLTSQYLKVCHHGSSTSSSPEFLNAIWKDVHYNDRYALISSGRKQYSGSYIPTTSVLSRLLSDYIDISHLFATSVGDGNNTFSNKSERDSYRDDNILIVVHPDGSHYACYSGPN